MLNGLATLTHFPSYQGSSFFVKHKNENGLHMCDRQSQLGTEALLQHTLLSLQELGLAGLSEVSGLMIQYLGELQASRLSGFGFNGHGDCKELRFDGSFGQGPNKAVDVRPVRRWLCFCKRLQIISHGKLQGILVSYS